MKIICRPMAGGKTYRAVKMLRENKNLNLLVMCEEERVRICKNYDLSPEEVCRVFSWQKYRTSRTPLLCSEKVEFLIDNAELFIEFAIREMWCNRSSVNAVTLTGIPLLEEPSYTMKFFPVTETVPNNFGIKVSYLKKRKKKTRSKP